MRIEITKTELQAIANLSTDIANLVDKIKDVGMVKKITIEIASFLKDQTLIETKAMKIVICNGNYILELNENFTYDIFAFYSRILTEYEPKVVTLFKAIMAFSEIDMTKIEADCQRTVAKWL